MRKLVFVLLLSCTVTIAADFDDTRGPWWETEQRGSETLPSLVSTGWRIVGYSTSHGDATFSQNYVLQHPDKPGAWWCNWFSVTTDSNLNIIASCSKIRQSSVE